MKKKTGIKHVNKIVILFIILISSNKLFSQRVRYLLFDKTKDNIVILSKNKYYKIDNNLFKINEYNQIDTIPLKKVNKIKFYSPKELFDEGYFIVKTMIKKAYKAKEFVIIEETNNYYFPYIYILEKIPCSKFKRTRVWWNDY